MKEYFYLFLAIVFELIGTISMKLVHGPYMILWGLNVVACYLLCLFFLVLTMKTIELSFAYAIWAGIGTAVTAIVGIKFFEEQVNLMKILSLALIIMGVIGLHLSKELG